ncbi:MAG: hypothetical protein Q9170_001334 [Blastenia crenularia]
MSLVSGPGRARPTTTDLPNELRFVVEKHVQYIQSLDKRKDELEYWLTEHLRLNGVYWGLTALHLLGHPDALPRQQTIDFVLACQHDNGGFGAAPGHDAHMLYTVSAIQVLVTVDALDDLDDRGKAGRQGVGSYISQLQNHDDGSFAGDEWGESDTRFLFGALNALSLLQLLPLIDMSKAISYVQACANCDGGYGVSPGAESHAGQIFVCVGALSIAGRLDLVDQARLGGWLSERQIDAGGFNGRPEKLEDVCYSWWVGSSLAMIGKLHWIDKAGLTEYILRCQDPELGGLADRPGDMVDVFHTVFAIAGLSLIGFPNIEPVDPVYCMPKKIVDKALGRQDPATRTQLDIYDQWYTDNQIEKLLSQRMVLKDSKRPNGTARATNKPRLASTKPSKVSRVASKIKGSAKPEKSLSKADPDNVIDPRLSQVPSASVQQSTSPDPSASPSSPGLDITSVYRAPVPRMRTFHTPNSTPVSPEEFHNQLLSASKIFAATEDLGDDPETESEQEHLGANPHRKPSYPELPTTEPVAVSSQVETGKPPCRRSARGRPRRGEGNGEKDVETEEEFIPKTPELKGVCYPGMSLFDSASLDAQRKRNQRKSDSLIAQIEQESFEVKCDEYIYWPDGSLKMCRFITGDVQSTPPKESTPPPLPPKRRRGRKPKVADNTVGRRKLKRAKEMQIPEELEPFAVKRETSMSQSLGWPDQSSNMDDTFSGTFDHTATRPWTEAEDSEWLLNTGAPILGNHRLTPLSLGEEADAASDPVKAIQNPLPFASGQENYGSARAYPSWKGGDAAKFTSSSKGTRKSLAPSAYGELSRESTERTTLGPQATCSVAKLEKENMPPERGNPKPSSEWSTHGVYHAGSHHRYTMIKGDEDPQVFNSLPAEMAFAGLGTPPVYRMSLNPLNPNAHLRQSLPFSNNYTPFEGAGLPDYLSHDNITRQMRQKPVVDGNCDKQSSKRTSGYWKPHD